MSGIFAYTGSELCRDLILKGLCLLESNGSALCGFSEKGENGISAYRLKGSPSQLITKTDKIKSEGYTGLSECKNHFRSLENPALVPAANEYISVASDGDIQNFEELKSQLPLNLFIKDDGELILSLLLTRNEDGRIKQLKEVSDLLKGAPSLAVIHSDEEAIYCAAGEMPLYICMYESGVSVTNSISSVTNGVIRYQLLEKGEFARVTKERAHIFDCRLKRIKKPFLSPPEDFVNNMNLLPSDGLYALPIALKNTLSLLSDSSKITLGSYKLSRKLAERTQRIILAGSGCCYNAAAAGAYSLEQLTDIPCSAHISGELVLSPTVFDRETLLIILSDTPDDKDACACLNRAKEFGAKVIAVTDLPHSYLAKCADGVISLNESFSAGKSRFSAFISFTLTLSLIALKLGYMREIINSVYYNVALKMSEMLAGKVSASIKPSPLLTAFSRSLVTGGRVVFTGLCADRAIAGEAAEVFRDTAGINAFHLSLAELENEDSEYLKSSKIIAVITDKEYAYKTLKTAGQLAASGIDITLVAGESIAQELFEAKNVLTYPDSLPLFNRICAAATLYNAAVTALSLTGESKEQKAV